MPARARAIFLGSGSFAVPILEAVADHPDVALVGVVSAPDRPAGRGARPRAVPVASLARERGWALLQPVRLRDPDAEASVAALDPGVLLLADYGGIVPASLLEVPPHGALNVHPSLLPRHRGASPVAAAILAGDAETGVSVIRMDEGIDSGPIVARERVALRGDETAAELEARLAGIGARLIAEVLGPWLRGGLPAVPQPADGVTMTRLLRREDGRLDWRRGAAELERQVRAHHPWPGSFSGSPAGRLIVRRAAVLGEPAVSEGRREGPAPGTVVASGRGLAVATGSGLLELVEVQLPGRAPMSGRDLRNGYPGLVGARLGEPR